MMIVRRLLEILVLTILADYQCSRTHGEIQSTFFFLAPSFMLENCERESQTAALKCANLCAISPNGCVGMVYARANASQSGETPGGACQLCLAAHSRLVATTSSSGQRVFVGYNRLLQREGPPYFYAHFPDGLYVGQVIVLEGVPDYRGMMLAMLLSSATWDDDIHRRPDCSLMFHANFVLSPRPHKISVDNFRAADQTWPGPLQLFQTADFLQAGVASQWLLVVTDVGYSIFINGQLMTHYPRPATLALKDIKAIKVQAPFTTIKWLE